MAPPEPATVRLAGGAALFLAGTVGGRAFKLGTRVAIGRLLGASALGAFDLAITVVLILATMLRRGFGLALVRFGAPMWPDDRMGLRRLLLRAMAVPIVVGSALAVGMTVLAGPIALGAFKEPALIVPLRIVAPLVPLLAGISVLAATAHAAQRIGLTATLREVTEPVLGFVLFILLYALGLGMRAPFWGSLIAGAGAFTLALVVALRLTRRQACPTDTRDAFSLPSQRRLLAFSLPVGLTGMLMAYLLWIDRLMLGYFLSAGEVGIYSAASQMGILFALVLSGLQTAFAPMLSTLHAKGEHGRLEELFHATTKWGLYLLIPLLAALFLLPESVLGGVFGHQFAAGARPLQILLLGQLLNVITGPVGLVLNLTGRERLWLTFAASALTMNVLLNLLWIPRYGLSGSAGASAIAFGALYGVGALTVRRLTGFWPLDVRRGWKLLPAAAIAFLTLRAIAGTDLPSSLPGLALALVSGYATFGAARLLLPTDPEDRELLESLRRRLGSRGSESGS